MTDFKVICRKLQYKEKVFGEFQGSSCFPRRMVLYSSNTTFDAELGIKKP